MLDPYQPRGPIGHQHRNGEWANTAWPRFGQCKSRILKGFQACGCTLNNPNMQLSLLGLVVIPELRISDLGLVDVTKFEFIPVLEE